MSRWGVGAVALLVLAGCTLKPGATSVVAPKRSTSAPVASGVPGSLPAAKRAALVSALHTMVSANRAAKATSTLRETSGIVSNNAGNIISDNGLGLIGNNGAGYRVLAAKTSYTETPELVYAVTVIDDKHGEFKTYDKTPFKTALTDAERDKALLDHFKWDDVTISYEGAPPSLTVAMTYHLKKVTSKRLSFLDTIRQHELHAYTFADGQSEPNDKLKGMEIEFDTAVVLPGGRTDTAHFKGVAGEADIDYPKSSDGGDQYFPRRLTLTGRNDAGEFEGELAGADYPVTTMTHTDKATGKKARLTMEVKKGGAITRTTDLADEQLRVVLNSDAAGLGTGQLLDTSSATPKEIGTITWDADGLGTIAIKGSRPGEPESFQVQLF